MAWTLENLLFGIGGIAIVVGCVFVLKYRAGILRLIIRGNTSMYGNRAGEILRKKATPMTGVGVPAIGGMLIGLVWIWMGLIRPLVT